MEIFTVYFKYRIEGGGNLDETYKHNLVMIYEELPTPLLILCMFETVHDTSR